MKILYYHQHFTTPTGSSGTRSYEFAKKLIEKNHQVTMVCGSTSKLNLTNEISKNIFRGNVDGIDVIQIDLPYSNKDGLFKRAKTFLKFALKGIQVARSEDYDLLFATSTPLTAGIPGIWMKMFSNRNFKFVFEVRDLWPELPKALGVKNPFLLGGMKILERLSYNKADSCIGLSPGICEGINKEAKDKTTVMIPNGCDLAFFQPGNRTELKLPTIQETDTVAVFTGAHGIANGLDAVLDVALELKERGNDTIKLVFIGDGKLKSELKQRADNQGLSNCLFLDPVPKTQLKNILGKVDVGLMVLKNVPEFYYGTSPNKFFDYISSGIPVINNYPGWLADLIKENECGIAVSPNSPKEFADALEYLSKNSLAKFKYGENSRKLAELQFSRDDLANKFVQFLEQTEKK